MTADRYAAQEADVRAAEPAPEPACTLSGPTLDAMTDEERARFVEAFAKACRLDQPRLLHPEPVDVDDVQVSTTLAYDVADDALALVASLLDAILPPLVRETERGTDEYARLVSAQSLVADAWAHLVRVKARLMPGTEGPVPMWSAVQRADLLDQRSRLLTFAATTNGHRRRVPLAPPVCMHADGSSHVLSRGDDGLFGCEL